MSHDVFICHSSKDRTIANAICSKLEQNRIRCWIAPRDVIPGREYAQSIIEAISGSKLTVLVFSDNSNQSPHVHREIERTVSHGIPILPFRVEDVIPSPALEYFISDAHWLDAITPPMEQHLHHLAGTVRLLLDRAAGGTPGDPAPEPAPSPPAKLPQPPTGGPSGASKLPTWWRWAALGAVALVVVVAAWVLVLGGRHTGGTAAPVATSSAPVATSSAPVTTSPEPAAPSATVKATAKLGGAISLNGIMPGTKAVVTAIKVVDPTTSTDGFDTPGPGNRYVAVQFQIQNTGTLAYNDVPANSAKVLDASGHQFEAPTVTSTSAGPLFPTNGIALRPGQKAVGYIVFEVPTKSKVAKLQFILDSGYAFESGQWTVQR